MNNLAKCRQKTKSVNPVWTVTDIDLHDSEFAIINAYSMYLRGVYREIIPGIFRYSWSFCSALVSVIEHMPTSTSNVRLHIADLLLMDHLSTLDPIT